MIEFAVLGSGSSGNSAVVCYGSTRVLVDAGLSARQLESRLNEIGVHPDSLTAIVLTHEHGDHVQGLEVFCRKRSIPVYATVHTSHIVQQDRIKSASICWRKFEAGCSFVIGDFEIDSFNVPHDAVDPVGFVFKSPAGSVGILSDVGHVTRLIVERLKGVDSLFVESNYDDVMLQNDEKRPWSLKQRISNRHGHLSNKQTAELLKEIATSDLNRVILGHLSSDCNTVEKALEFAREALKELGFSDVEVECAQRHKPTLLYPAVKGVEMRCVIHGELDSQIAAALAAVEAELEKSESVGACLVEAKITPNPQRISHLQREKQPLSVVEKIRFVDDEICSPNTENNLVQMELTF
jgi:phosphoribosyl 1,2-cyclic phosphodiesterase